MMRKLTGNSNLAFDKSSTPARRKASFSASAARLAALLAIFSLALHLRSQQPVPETSVQSRGMATGGAHATVRDALHRPITAGGFVDDAPVIFTDVTKQSGLDKFRHRSGTTDKSTIIDAPGSG